MKSTVFITGAIIFALFAVRVLAFLKTVEESESEIRILRPSLAALDRKINSVASGEINEDIRIKKGAAIIARKAAINAALKAIAEASIEDAKIFVRPSKRVFEEKKSILGLEISNYLDAVRGYANADLRSARAISLKIGEISIEAEASGSGEIVVFGKYLVFKGYLSAETELFSKILGQFKFSPEKGKIFLRPVGGHSFLDFAFKIKILGNDFTIRKRVKFDLAEAAPSIEIPASISARFESPFAPLINGAKRRNWIAELKRLRFETKNDRIFARFELSSRLEE